MPASARPLLGFCCPADDPPRAARRCLFVLFFHFFCCCSFFSFSRLISLAFTRCCHPHLSTRANKREAAAALLPTALVHLAPSAHLAHCARPRRPLTCVARAASLHSTSLTLRISIAHPLHARHAARSINHTRPPLGPLALRGYTHRQSVPPNVCASAIQRHSRAIRCRNFRVNSPLQPEHAAGLWRRTVAC